MIKIFNKYNDNVLIYKKGIMKKIFILLGIFILSFFSLNTINANSVIEEKIDKLMISFYIKIDKYDIEKKVSLLERINGKIDYIKENKLDILNESQKAILFRVEYNNDKKITFYNNEEKDIVDNIISYIKIEDWNKLVFDLISWDKFKYVIYMNKTPINASTSSITWQTDFLWWLKKRWNEWVYNLKDYFNWKYYFEVKAYRKTWSNYDYKFVTSYSNQMELTWWIVLNKENKLDNIKLNVSKTEIFLGESIDLSFIWYNKNWVNYIVEEESEMVGIHSTEYNRFAGRWVSIPKWIFKGEYKNLKFTVAGLNEIKVCQNYLCWYIHVNVKKQDIWLEEHNLEFDGNNKIFWKNIDWAYWYELRLLINSNETKGTKASEIKKTLIWKTEYILPSNLFWESFLISVVWFEAEPIPWFTSFYKDWSYKEIYKWERFFTWYMNDWVESNNCKTLIDGITYSLEPCGINETLIKWEWDKDFSFKLNSSNMSKWFHYSVGWNPDNFPLNSILWWVSWGFTDSNSIINRYFSEYSLQVWKYSWYLWVGIKWPDWKDSILRFYINLEVK